MSTSWSARTQKTTAAKPLLTIPKPRIEIQTLLQNKGCSIEY